MYTVSTFETISLRLLFLFPSIILFILTRFLVINVFFQVEDEEVEEENLNDADSELEEEEVEEEPTSGE